MELAATRLGRPIRLPGLSQRYERGALIVGKYRLEAQLGEGGMGTVWLARNEALDAPVALKLIRSGMQGEETVERLLLEARVEAKLKHPNIVRVFDFGQTELGDAFIVMEMLEGISLGQLLQERGRLEARKAVRLVLPVIGALCHAHENGVVHRDLKPENIFLDRGGLHAGTKLLDFGIAKLIGDHSHPHFTEGGSLLGSPAYMAPEQVRGAEDVDHRADIWAMCVVLHETISGKPVFSGEGEAILRSILEDEVPALEAATAGESALQHILSRGLEKDPSRRFQSMRVLGTALAQWLCDRGESEDLDGNPISRRWGVERSSTEDFDPVELPFRTAASLARALRRSGMSQRTADALRMTAAVSFGIAVVLAPSRVPVESAMSAGTEQVQDALVPQAPSIHLASATPLDAVVPAVSAISDPRPSRAVEAPSRRKPRESSKPERPSRPLTESELGLKVPY